MAAYCLVLLPLEKPLSRRIREDLYYRLNGVTIRVPPLRERPEDLLPLAEHFLERSSRKARKALRGFGAEALALMRQYRWPGNVRELEHAVERAVLLAVRSSP